MYNNPNKYRLGLFKELMDDVQGFVDISETKVNDMEGAFMPNMEVMHLCLWSSFSRILVVYLISSLNCFCWKWNYKALQIRASTTGILLEESEIFRASDSDKLRFLHAASAHLFIFSPSPFLFSWMQSVSA